MKIDHHDEEPIVAGDLEYQRLYAHAASVYEAEEIEAWQIAQEILTASSPLLGGGGEEVRPLLVDSRKCDTI